MKSMKSYRSSRSKWIKKENALNNSGLNSPIKIKIKAKH